MKQKQYEIESAQGNWEFYVNRYQKSKEGMARLIKEGREGTLLFAHYEKQIEDCLKKFPCLNK